MKITDELDEYKFSLEKRAEIRNEIAFDMLEKMNRLDRENKKPVLILDTYINATMERYTRPDGTQFNQRDAFNAVLGALELNREILKSDGVMITFRHGMLTCGLGHRYSDALRTCPDKTHKIGGI